MSKFVMMIFLLLLAMTAGTSQAAPSQDLINAAKAGDAAAVSRLLAHGVKPGVRDSNGWTPLMHAAYQGHEEVFMLLLDNGARLDERNGKGSSLLAIAANGGQTGFVEWLHKHGAGVNDRNRQGGTPLYFAAGYGHLDTVRYLVEAGADVDARFHNGWTPLMYAAFKGHARVAEYLLQKGADAALVNDKGQDAVQMASGQGHKDIAALIRDHQRKQGGQSLARSESGKRSLKDYRLDAPASDAPQGGPAVGPANGGEPALEMEIRGPTDYEKFDSFIGKMIEEDRVFKLDLVIHEFEKDDQRLSVDSDSGIISYGEYDPGVSKDLPVGGTEYNTDECVRWDGGAVGAYMLRGRFAAERGGFWQGIAGVNLKRVRR